MPSRLTQREYIAILALTSTAILGLGVWLKPKQLPEPTISGEETLRLQTLTQRRNLENLAVYFSEVAGGIQPGLAWLNELGSTGLIWNQAGLIVTAGPNHPPPGEVSALTTSGNISLEPQVLSESFRIAALKPINGPRLQPVRKGTTAGLTPGIWIIQVARQAGGQYLFTPGVYAGTSPTTCGSVEYQALQSNLPLTESALGGGLFDVDGNLLAVVVRCDDRFAAILPPDVDKEIARATTFEGQLVRAYGLQVAPLNAVSRKYAQATEGVMVIGVADGHAADLDGLNPGDVITALDKVPVRIQDDLRPLTASKDRAALQLVIQRNRRTVRIDVPASAPFTSGEPHGGMALTDASQGYLVEAVVRGSRAARAGIQAGDRLLQIDGKQPQNVTAVRKALSDDNHDPIFVVLHRGSRKMGTFLNDEDIPKIR
ncbi:MAG: PDZ domain-containing protein [Bryobacteraceae bacterium]